MADYIISTCSTFDLTKEHAEKRDIHYINFHYTKDGVKYEDDLFQTVTPNEFYQSMVDGAEMKTSQVNAGEFMEYFRGFLKDGKDILHISLSSGISGVYNAATTAAAELRDSFPDRKIYIVDSLAASGGMGLLVDKLADLRDEGYTVDQLHDWVEENKLRLHHWFFSTDLTFYIKGGRVSKLSGAIGGVLGICPLLNVSNEGKLIPRAKIRPKKKVIVEIVKRMEEHAECGGLHVQEERLKMRCKLVIARERDDIGIAVFGAFKEFLELVLVIDDGIVDEQQTFHVARDDAGNVVAGCVCAVCLQLQITSPHAKVKSAIFGEEKFDVVFLQKIVGVA